MHRDLKPENILIRAGEDGDYKLTNSLVVSDFGLSCKFKKGEIMNKYAGTLNYMPPELMKGEKKYTEKFDVWSLGVVAYVLLLGRYPFHGKSRELTSEVIYLQGTGESVISYQPPGNRSAPKYHISSSAKKFLERIFTMEQKRPTMESLLEDPWLKLTNEEINSISLRMVNGNPVGIIQDGASGGGHEENSNSRLRVHQLRKFLANKRARRIAKKLAPESS
jgi:calcium-dependent protein kinase